MNKIMQVCSYYLGTQLYEHLFSELQNLGVKQKVYVYASYGTKINRDLLPFVDLRFCYHEWERAFFHLKHTHVLKEIGQIMNSDEYALSHAHSLFSNGYISLRLKQIYGLPYVVTVRNTDLNVFFKWMLHLRPLGRKILMEAEKIIFLSPTYLEQVDAFIPEDEKTIFLNKSVVIPNGIDQFWLNNQSPYKKWDQNMINAIYVGTMDRNKNLGATLRALDILEKQGYAVKYTAVGKMVKNYNKEFKKRSYVTVYPHQTKENLIKMYRKHNVFIMPSRYETFGLVYAEAMSQSLPVIYTKNQGFDGQFKEGQVGYHVAADNPEEIAEKVIMALENCGENNAKLAAKFSWFNIAQEIKDIYEQYAIK